MSAQLPLDFSQRSSKDSITVRPIGNPDGVPIGVLSSLPSRPRFDIIDRNQSLADIVDNTEINKAIANRMAQQEATKFMANTKEAFLLDTTNEMVIPLSEFRIMSIKGDPKQFKVHTVSRQGMNGKASYKLLVRHLEGWTDTKLVLSVDKFSRDRMREKDPRKEGIGFYITATVETQGQEDLLRIVDQPGQTAWLFIEEEV